MSRSMSRRTAWWLGTFLVVVNLALAGGVFVQDASADPFKPCTSEPINHCGCTNGSCGVVGGIGDDECANNFGC